MKNNLLRFRQIHLDFHTNEQIEGVASNFNADDFADTLVKARVDSVNLFARCHHGWLYYDSMEFPELIHPHLKNRNLLKEQIQACHARNIKAPIYFTIQWDYHTVQKHPEWLTITPDGRIEGTPPFEAGFYQHLCLNTPYVDYIKPMVKEIIQTLPVDGFWFDIVQPMECCCTYCRESMKEKGYDPLDQTQRIDHGIEVVHNFKADMTRFVKEHVDDCLIFYNAGHVGPKHRKIKDVYTHLELESLPGGIWGYMHFPVTARYARTMGMDYLGMTGKFHTAWGDFHSFKNKASLEFECFNMLALNAKCCIGDQLHPSGKICKDTYELIGSVYSSVEQKEPWCKNARPVTEIGLFTPEEFNYTDAVSGLHAAICGSARMLQEGGYQFDIIDTQCDFENYKLLILPDDIPVDKDFAAKLNKYLDKGGKIIASYESGMDEAKLKFNLEPLGVEYTGRETYDAKGKSVRGKYYPSHDFVDYVVPRGEIGTSLPETEHVMYMRGLPVKETTGGKVLAYSISSYFDRTYEHFCSHLQTPSSGKQNAPAVIATDKTIYFAHPVFTNYDTNAPLWCKKMFLNAVNMLLPEQVVKHNGPSSLITTINEQTDEKRWVIHLLHYIPERRSTKMDVIEDVIPLHDIELSVLVSDKPKKVELVPQMQKVDFEYSKGRVNCKINQVEGHQMISVSYI